MTAVVTVLFVLELVAGGVLVWWALRSRALPPEVSPDLRPGAPENPVLRVEVLNPHELAARESWAARRFGSLVPRIVAREVAARAAEQMAEQLAEQGVRADVRIVSPRG